MASAFENYNYNILVNYRHRDIEDYRKVSESIEAFLHLEAAKKAVAGLK